MQFRFLPQIKVKDFISLGINLKELYDIDKFVLRHKRVIGIAIQTGMKTL